MVLGKLERNKMIQSNTVLVNIEDFDFKDWTALETPSVAIKFTDDPLALSCASYRLGEETGSRWLEIEQMKATDVDREEAARLRKYYMDRLVFERLTKPTVSPFREKMGAFLAGNYEITKKDIGMLYKLPYFYAEDQAIDSIMESTVDIPGTDTPQPFNNIRRLTPLKKLFQSRKTGERTQFWFTTESNQPVAFTVQHSNPLFGMVDSLFAWKSVTLHGNYRVKEHLGTHRKFYSVYSARIVDMEQHANG